ncbi:MAG: SPOR domain-containing protein [Gammaproteobacteria bacterium]|nr:SPOR domain-containing protein [Gammaproteobacteria bacterium]
MRPIALLTVCLCSIANAADYWVSVGSFVDSASAERVRDEANRAGSIRFGVTGTETGKGYYYRVVAGPYATYDEATRESSIAAASGFENAWIFTQPFGAFSGSSFQSDYVLPDYNFDSLPSLQDDYQLPDYDLGLPSVVPSREPGSIVKPTEEPVMVAPPGYQLNRLKRDA